MKKIFRKLLGKKDKAPVVTPLEQLPKSPEFFRAYRYWISCPDMERADGGFMYRGRFYPDYLNAGGACHAIFREAQKYCIGTGIDVGAGFWALPDSLPIDTNRGEGLNTSIEDIAESSQDYVFSSHCLEHIDNWQEALTGWVSKIKQGGTLFLYLPHPECEIWHPGAPFVGDGHKWIPTPEIIKHEVTNLGLNIIAFDDGPDTMQSFYVCARKND